MNIEPNLFVRKYGPWSISKADTVRNCPRKFKYQYIEKIRKLEAPKKGDALVGKAIHKLLEYAIRLNKPANLFTANVISEFTLTGEDVDRFNSLVPAADSLVARLAKSQLRWSAFPPKIEQKLAVDINGHVVNFFDDSKAFFRGVIDISYQIKNRKHLIVMDHKTGKYRDINYYKSQMDGYLWLVKGLDPELEAVQTAVNYLQTDQTIYALIERVPDAGELGDRVIAFLNKSTAKVTDLEVMTVGPLCLWCDYHSICPSHGADGTYGKENTDADGEGANP
jgi:CRISPR/Cas system-associated exonuclease Cas4 (RecB family)